MHATSLQLRDPVGGGKARVRVHEVGRVVDVGEAQDVVPHRRLERGDFALANSLALASVGPVLLPRRIAREGTPGRLRRLHAALPIYRDSVPLVFRSDLHRTRGAVFLKDALLRRVGAMPSVGL